jgi:hypothetical protein
MRRAQYSVETLFVVGISAALLIPMMFLFYSFLLSSSDNILKNQVEQTASAFVQDANLVYNYGPGAMLVLDISLPDRIVNMSIDNKDTLAIRMQTGDGVSDYSYPFGINVTGTFAPGDYIRGKKSFRFTYQEQGDLVSIERIRH